MTDRSVVERDSAVLRLVYTFEAIWQACQQLLAESEKIATATANQTIHAAHLVEWLSADEMDAVLKILHDRNLVAHTYRDEIGDEIEARLVVHAAMLRRWLEVLRERAGS